MKVFFFILEFLDIRTLENNDFYNIKTSSNTNTSQLKNKRERGKTPCEICGKVKLI